MEKTNPILNETIAKLEEESRKEGTDLWKDVAERLEKGTRRKEPVNLAKINRHTQDGETVLVPGKVTGYGTLYKEVEIAAFSFSKDAKRSIEKTGEAMSILELLEKNPEGKGVKIMEG